MLGRLQVSPQPQAQAELIRLAIRAGKKSESYREKSNQEARRRQDAILALSELGLSVRNIGALIGISSARVQSAIVDAKARRHERTEETDG